jgi:hypothetical protein
MAALPVDVREHRTSKSVAGTIGFYDDYLQEEMAVDSKSTVHYYEDDQLPPLVA